MLLHLANPNQANKRKNMKPTFDITPFIGTDTIKLNATRETLLIALNQPTKAIKKYPERQQLSDALYRNDLHISYQGQPAVVESIEFAFSDLYEVSLLGESILSLPTKSALAKVEAITGCKPITNDDGFTYEFSESGIWLWRESNDNFDENGFYFFTIGVRCI
tara:strand:- start:689 stop:1177 length:489 start_codon:yes stop_codon:yes gene_type:complete